MLQNICKQVKYWVAGAVVPTGNPFPVGRGVVRENAKQSNVIMHIGFIHGENYKTKIPSPYGKGISCLIFTYLLLISFVSSTGSTIVLPL